MTTLEAVVLIIGLAMCYAAFVIVACASVWIWEKVIIYCKGESRVVKLILSRMKRGE